VLLLSLVAEGISEFLELNSDDSAAALRRGRPCLEIVDKGLNAFFCSLLRERRGSDGLDTDRWVERNVHG